MGVGRFVRSVPRVIHPVGGRIMSMIPRCILSDEVCCLFVRFLLFVCWLFVFYCLIVGWLVGMIVCLFG